MRLEHNMDPGHVEHNMEPGHDKRRALRFAAFGPHNPTYECRTVPRHVIPPGLVADLGRPDPGARHDEADLGRPDSGACHTRADPDPAEANPVFRHRGSDGSTDGTPYRVDSQNLTGVLAPHWLAIVPGTDGYPRRGADQTRLQ